jgi:hypothetical protein
MEVTPEGIVIELTPLLVNAWALMAVSDEPASKVMV